MGLFLEQLYLQEMFEQLTMQSAPQEIHVVHVSEYIGFN